MAAEDKRVTRVLFCGFDFPSSQEYTREYLQDYSFIEVDDVALDEIPNVIAKYDMCVVKNRIFDANLVTSAVKMKLMMQFGVGLEGVDIDAATKLNIKVGKIPARTSGNASSCAELAIYLMLGLLRKQVEGDGNVYKAEKIRTTNRTDLTWENYVRGRVFSWASAGASGFRSINKGTPYAAQAAALNVIRAARGQGVKWAKVMIKGTGRGGDVALRAILKRFGAIGIELARRLRPFGVKIIAIKRNWSLNDAMLQNGEIDGLVDQKGLPQDIYEFAGEADIVVTCLTLYSETVGIVDDKFLSSLRKGSFVVNVARGGILDYTSVLQHLNSGHLGGLAIDVAWTEPFDSEDPILKFPNVLITPHVAGVTEFSYRKMAKVVADTAIQLHEGSPITGLEFVN